MSDQCPKVRTDLVVTRQETPEGPYFVVKDPRTRRFFRLRETEYAVARRLDGTRRLESVAEQVGSLSVGGRAYALHAGPSNDGPLAVGATGDLSLFEVA